jgi:hypothetical protein
VRGDSLRDFYAKTLAVLGLGVLAATGAAVDYWPVGEEWPSVSAAAGLRPDAPAPLQPLVPGAPAAPRRVTRPQHPPTFVMTEADDPSPIVKSAPALVLEPPPAPESFIAVSEALPALLLVETIDLEPPPAVEATPEDSHRVLGDAVRRTRESLGAARVFLSDALSGMVGAFRRVNPFFATGAAGLPQ